VRGEGRLLETETGCGGRSGEGEEWQEEEGGGEEAEEGMHGGKDRGIIGESRCGGLCNVILYERPSSRKMHATCAKQVRGWRASLASGAAVCELGGTRHGFCGSIEIGIPGVLGGGLGA